MNNESIKEIVETFNFNQINSIIEKEKYLLRYNKILSICLHIVNALSIIFSVLAETVTDKLILGTIICAILNSIISYEIMKCHNNLQFNLKVVNQYLQKNNIKTDLFVPDDNIVGRRQTPNNTPMISV